MFKIKISSELANKCPNLTHLLLGRIHSSIQHLYLFINILNLTHLLLGRIHSSIHHFYLFINILNLTHLLLGRIHSSITVVYTVQCTISQKIIPLLKNIFFQEIVYVCAVRIFFKKFYLKN